MEESMPIVFAELARVFDLLERHYRDMQDIEFTVERGKLFCSRPALASAPPRPPFESPSTWRRKA